MKRILPGYRMENSLMIDVTTCFRSAGAVGDDKTSENAENKQHTTSP